ncbi:MAG: hypothetical protein JO067_13830 [Cupriavidus sp.]|nr:hypothetical protein [Cupriavidus sp.]
MMRTIRYTLPVLLASYLLVQSSDAQARGVKSVTIEKIGASTKSSDREYCKPFRPSVEQIRDYFSHAYPVPGVYALKPRYSPCYATGRVQFDDGFDGKWIIYSGGTSYIDWSIGGQVTLFYKKRKWFDPYTDMYDDDFDLYDEDNIYRQRLRKLGAAQKDETDTSTGK